MNDILFGMIGTIGNIALIRENPDFAIKNVALIKDIKKINYLYLYQYLQSNNIAKQFDENMDGGTQKFIALNKVRDLSIMYPTISEQIQIGGFLEKLDNLITLHHRKFSDILVYKLSTKFLFLKFAKNVWEQRKLPEIANISIGLVTTMTSHYMNHGVLLIRNSDIKDNKFEFDTDPIYLDEKFASENKHRQHQIGDVITVHTGDVGTSAVITENEVNSIGFATLISRPNKEIIDSHYLSTFYNTDKHKKFAVLMSTGDGRTNYNLGDFIELIVPFPKKGEQIKIARFIKNIDNLITLHHRKYTYIFYSWEQRKLGDECFELIAGGDIDKTKSVNNGKYPIYANALTNDGIVGYYNDSYRVKSPAVTITGRGEIGYAMARNTDFTPVVRLISLRSKHNNYFLANAINLLNVVSESTGVPQLTIPQVEKFDIYFPKNINEEIKLGRLFNEIDNLITLHQHKELKRRNDNNEHLRW